MDRWSTLLLALVTALLLVACGGGREDGGGSGAEPATERGARPDAGAEEPGTETLDDMVLPDLSAAASEVREQIGEARAEVERLRAAGAPPGELATAYGNLGLILLSYQFFDSAEDALGRAHALQPESMRWTYLLGWTHRSLGRPEPARELLEQALAMEPDYVPALVRLGRVRLEGGDVEEARRLFERAAEIAPDSAGAWEGLGRVAVAEERYDRAVEHFRRALEMAPWADSLHYRLGQALVRAGRTKEAREELERAGDQEVVLEDPLLQSLGGMAENVQRYLVQGGEAMQDERYDDAVGIFRRALEIAPGSYRALSGLGWALLQVGDLEGAEEQLRRSVEAATNPMQRAEGAGALASVLLSAGRDAEAVEALRTSLEADPDRTGLRRHLADALSRLGRFDEALEQYDRLLRSAGAGKVAELRLRRALVLVNLDRGEEAVAELHRAVEAEPSDVSLRIRLAEILEHLGRRDEAQRERRAARELSQQGGGDQRAALAVGEGHTLARRGDFSGAVEKYRQALEAAPERHDVRIALANLLGRLGRYDEALVEFGRVLEADPDRAAARRGEIAALILSGRYGTARVQLNEALRRFTRDKGLALTQVRLLAAAPDPRVRDGELALAVARRVAADSNDPVTRDSLALALARSGRLEEAVRIQRDLVEEARRRGAEQLAERLAERLAAYEAGRPWEADQPAELLAFALDG